MQSIKKCLTRWGSITPYVYTAVLLLGIILGFIAGAMINNDGGAGSSAGDPIAILSWFILFPIYIIADGILNCRFLWCPLRAAFIPLVQGFVIWQVTGWEDPFAVSISVAFLYLLGSLVVVGITRIVRKSKKT